MGKARSRTADKVAALKQKLQPQRPRVAGGAAQARPQHSALDKKKAAGKKALGGGTVKHSAGRRDLRRSLDRVAAGARVGDALRGIGAPDAASREQRAREDLERAAQAYEHQQAAVDRTVDELARLMAA
ncbi:hypothetical protein H4R18_000576 [Coemansia javaensis]|uniref:Uncharacterized protein n=1 Tax=Coemansia javaensis TaxID=2761396 RepID=A0A9W8HJD6_9FUNG|nr:hypothetical protein H4R18_000576 [Coemansia javaensis]